ncbi:Eukaryotic translation initiation factor 3 subunit C [Trinorchestia longiramus]|nr:Eukaryotic translation initiation factor 3 subunit C [Trinorchestia longiramus]
MTSRFFMSDSGSSESESEEEVREPVNFLARFSDDEEDTKRVVRSAKEKRYEELQSIIKNMKNYKKNKDLASLHSSFEDLCRAYVKAAVVIEKEDGGKIPRFYIRCLVELEDYLNTIWEDKDGRKKMNKNNAKGLATMRQKLRKYVKEFEGEMKSFRENPDVGDSEEEEDDVGDLDQASDGEEDSLGPAAFKKETSVTSADSRSAVKVEAGDDADDEDDFSDWGTDSDESSSDSDMGGAVPLREKFLKKTVTREDEETKKKHRSERKKEPKAPKESDGGWETVKKGSVIPTEKPKMFGKDDEINIKTVTNKLNEIIAARGKKGTDRKEQIELVHELMGIARENDLGNAMYIKIQYHLIMSIYDYAPSGSDAMKPELWDKALKKIEELLEMLLAMPELSIGSHITEEEENLETAPYRVHGDVVTIIDRMDVEFCKLVKACDAHSNEFIVKLRDEVKVCKIIDVMLDYQERYGLVPDVCRIYLRKIEHVYYKYDKKAADQAGGKVPESEYTSLKLMDKLCTYIYVRDNTDRLRTRAVLCHIYHMALHDRWYQARDLMLMAHLQDTIQHSDLPTQILYNRTLVQLGLCGFRHAHIKEAHNALLDIQSGGRAKELLAQGLLPLRQNERTSEQEKQEKERQIPFHMHINLEMLECVYLVSAMLIEIPYMAAHEFDARRRMISKSFHHQLKNSERQSLVGPPESMREHVVAASKAMRNGNWRVARDLLLNEKMNGKVWDLFHNADDVREMLGRKVQEESLRTYLFTYSHVYDSISLVTLSEMFELPHHTVHAIISKMIINEEIMGSLDEPTRCLVMHKTEPSQLQSLSLQLADKLHNLVENNDRILDQKPFFQRNMQGGGYRDRQKPWGGNSGRDRRDGQDRGDRGGRGDYMDRRSNHIGERNDRGRDYMDRRRQD